MKTLLVVALILCIQLLTATSFPREENHSLNYKSHGTINKPKAWVASLAHLILVRLACWTLVLQILQMFHFQRAGTIQAGLVQPQLG